MFTVKRLIFYENEKPCYRLTVESSDGEHATVTVSNSDVAQRLDDYENTRMEPEEIHEMMAKMSRSGMKEALQKMAKMQSELQRYVDAEQEGRLSWHPNKLGDVVYALRKARGGDIVVKQTFMKKTHRAQYGKTIFATEPEAEEALAALKQTQS